MDINIKKYAVILCAGKATRAQLGYNKILYPLGQKNVLETTLDKFCNFDGIIVAVNLDDKAEISQAITGKYNNLSIVEGGATRTDSVKNSLYALKKIGAQEHDIVMIHDGARPFVTPKIIENAFKSAAEFGSGITCVKVTDSIKIAGGNIIKEGTNRNELYAAQTPQAFKFGDILLAYNKVEGVFEDDSDIYRLAGFTPHIVEGDYNNRKLTNPSDFFNLAACESVGTGFDVHQLVPDRKLILGGVHIPYPLGLLGHSDADVLLHAITDALLSAIGEGDIGNLFPDNDIKYKDIDSSVLLKEAVKRTASKGMRIKFVSAVIIAQAPKMMPHIPLICSRISEILEIGKECVNVSVTTTEFMGIVGDGKAIASSAVCLTTKYY